MSGCSICGHGVASKGMCSKHYRLRLNRGEFGLVDAAPVLAHLRKLDRLGWSAKQVADRAGVSHTTLYALLRGKHNRVRTSTAAPVLAVPLAPLVSKRTTSATGTRRRVEALNWMGWSNEAISTEAGLVPYALSKILWRDSVSFGTLHAVAGVYERLAGTPGGNRRAELRAKARGFAPPAAWEGLDMDDPKVKPEGVRIQSKKSPPLASSVMERWHGTTGGYSNHKCRCAQCTDAWRSGVASRKRRRFSQRVSVGGVLIHPTATHGKPTTYSNYGCRCAPCATAWRGYNAELKERRRAA